MAFIQGRCLLQNHVSQITDNNYGKSFVNVVVKFLFQVIFVFLLCFGMVMYANQVETKKK